MELSGSELQYFFSIGKKSTILRIGAELAEEVDSACLQRAAMCSLPYFPKLKTRPVLTSGGSVCLEENEEELPVFPEDGSTKKLGTDETAGYLFRLSCAERKIYFSYSHVLTDVRGGFSFLKCVLYEYCREKGIVPEEAGHLVSEEELSSPELLSVPSDFAAAPDTAFEPSGVKSAFHIPEEMTLGGTEFSKHFAVCIEKEPFLHRSKEMGASPVCFLMAAIAKSVCALYDADEDIVAGVPVDLHGLYGVPSQSNFTESVDLIFDEKMKALSCEESAGLLFRQLQEKKQKEALLHRVAVMKEGYHMIRQIPFDNEKLLRAVTQKMQYRESKMTFLLSNPGNVTVPEELRPQVTNLILDIPANGLSCMIVGYGSTVRLLLSQEWTDAALAEKISQTLRENGAENKLEDGGLVLFDEVRPGSFRKKPSSDKMGKGE